MATAGSPESARRAAVAAPMPDFRKNMVRDLAKNWAMEYPPFFRFLAAI
jgi:hypothetical protein